MNTVQKIEFLGSCTILNNLTLIIGSHIRHLYIYTKQENVINNVVCLNFCHERNQLHNIERESVNIIKDEFIISRLGAVHDGSPPPSYLGGPGAEKCRWEDGYIMSDLRHTEKGFKWSHCSVSSFHHFLK